MTLTNRNLRTYIPTEYFKHVGYDIQASEKSKRSVTAAQRLDALGQRVRDRFNEDLAYTEPAPKQIKLTPKILSEQKSQTSSIRVRQIHSSTKRPLSQQKKFINDFTLSQARSLISKVLTPKPKDVQPEEPPAEVQVTDLTE